MHESITSKWIVVFEWYVVKTWYTRYALFYSYVDISLNIYMKFSRQTTKINSSVISIPIMIVNGDIIITIADQPS